jgi:hypothetical protein
VDDDLGRIAQNARSSPRTAEDAGGAVDMDQVFAVVAVLDSREYYLAGAVARGQPSLRRRRSALDDRSGEQRLSVRAEQGFAVGGEGQPQPGLVENR